MLNLTFTGDKRLQFKMGMLDGLLLRREKKYYVIIGDHLI
jgi:hypothetical protein